MATIDTIYNYYLSTYGNTRNASRYDAHKKSELRSVYNNLVKINRQSPLYRIKDSERDEAQQFAIDIKESAYSLSKSVASLTADESTPYGAFKQRVATSSNENIVQARYIGSKEDTPNLNSNYDIQVHQLASNQINKGRSLLPNQRSLKVGQYTFDLENNATAYEFQYSVYADETNSQILDKINRLVNSAGVGVSSTIETNEDGNINLSLQSTGSGLSETETSLFRIYPGTDHHSQEGMTTLGLNLVSQPAQNSTFTINGKEHSSTSNSFTINNAFELKLTGVSNDDTASFGFQNDVEAISSNVEKLTQSYNRMLAMSAKYENTSQPSSKLSNELTSLASYYNNYLESMGITSDESGQLYIDSSLLSDSILSDDAEDNFKILNEFKDKLAAKSSKIALNPMDYVHKVVIAYKNPAKAFTAPYISSVYAGMVVDNYL